ncbi:DUF4221 domain-containing protein [Algoriphagus sp. AGSA1]|uniref:DUF4221 family protein n=1 Tax=Algoriphagus sp. AGSA1 TaxID=2907213 RepID=UPI001F2E99B7|nr:DUF4221 family protein [Algoriphagus sp. AGSA1]MCE7055928.1 DUF4221 domain-containing protein [Algoriphagus sp. AGSA1]
MNKIERLILIIAAGIVASCGSDRTNYESNLDHSPKINLTVEIDTVQVDPGEEHFIFLSRGLSTSSLSPDKKTLYNFNARVPELEVIDLDDLTLKEVIKLENEGPTGIAAANAYMPMMDISDNGELFLNTWNYLIKLNADRDQMSRFWFTPDSLAGDPISELEKIYPEGFISDDGDFFYSSYGIQDNKTPKSGLAIVNLATMELKKVPLDIFEKIEKFAIVFSPDGNSKISYTESVFIDPFEDEILVSSTAFNELYIVNLLDYSVLQKTYLSTITDDAKQGNFEKKANDENELFDLAKEKYKEVNFLKFHYDDQSRKFWRFSTQLDRMIGDSVAYTTVLTIFDKELNQLHEEKVDYSERGSLTFFKDGTLYSYINLEDELGFVRIKPTYE